MIECCCDATSCGKITVNARGCGGAVLNGVPVVVKLAGVTVATGTTAGTGTVTVDVPGNGTYSVVTGTAPYTVTSSAVVAACGTVVLTVSFVDKLSVGVTGCAGAVSGAVATWTVGGAGVGTCTTGGAGACTITLATPILLATSWAVSVAYMGRTVTGTGTGCTPPAFAFVDRVCVAVSGCCSPLAGVAVSLSGSNGASGSCTTDAAGACCLTPSVAMVASDTMTITYTKAPYATLVVASAAACSAGAVAVGPGAGYFCCAGCDEPVALPLTYTDSNGTFAITSVAPAICFGGVPAGPVSGAVCYGKAIDPSNCNSFGYADSYVRIIFQCDLSGGTKTFSVSVEWIGVECLVSLGVYTAFTNPNYNPGGGGNPCGQNNPGGFANTQNCSFTDSFTYPAGTGCPSPIALSGTWPASKALPSVGGGTANFPCPAAGPWSLSS